ncbi:MAG: DNA gyrase subunit A [Methylococcaceae bacterium]|nr:DNA gyrase subunit A [Methylococcaceae bacterium]
MSYSQLEQWGIINKLARIGSPLAEKLNHLINTYSVLTVNEVIKQTEHVETYDIQIADESHEFLVQGCAVHNCIGKYHPHGDTAVYDTMVRMAQPFSMRKMLIDGQGNFGSVDGDSPAAMRYTEVRMAKIAHEILADLDKETVDFVSNYDDSESEPSVMPTRIPTLLINGSSGIAVGMATNIPPHNLNEVVSGCLALMENPEMTIADLMQYIPGPDFPTAAFINGSLGIYDAYSTGRGKVHLRAKAHIEPFGVNDGREAIIVTELPYQVNKARLLEKIGEMHKEGKISGISALRDESDKDGMRMVVEVKRGEVAEVILNNLYKQTQLQTVFGINMVAILDGRPYCMSIKEILSAFINHRREVVTRRTLYLLRKARERAHILEGWGIALSNIDEMITLIKASKSPAEAREGLLGRDWAVGLVAGLLENADVTRSRPEELPDDFGINGELYKISPAQAQAILELRLHRLTGLEQDKIIAEFKQLLGLIDGYLLIISSDIRLMEVIKEELEAIKDEYSDPRRTVILQDRLSLATEDLITEEDMVVTMSHEGYVKSQPLTDYKAQKRGGRGKMAAATKQEDFVDKLIIANTHDTVLCFSSAGKVYGLKVYTLPVASRTSRGTPFVNILPLEKGEQINAMLTVREFSEDKFVFMATANGTVKKTPLKEFQRQPANGKIAIDLRDDNSLVGVAVTDGQQNVLLFSSNGKAICFNETDVRSMGRTAAGVRGIRLQEGQKIISLIIAAEGTVLNITENGFGKRTLIEKFNCQKRGGQGVIAIQTSERNGAVVGAVLVNDTDEIMLITDGGTLVRTRVAEISIVGRNAQGVTVIRPDSGEKVVGVGRIEGLPKKEVEAMLRVISFPCPTEFTLCRHYEQMITAKAEDCLNDAQKMEALENEYLATKSDKSENTEINDNTESDTTSKLPVDDE